MKKIATIIFCFILINLTLLSAISYPHGFNGVAEYQDGRAIPEGYVITGEVNGRITGSCVVSNGKYDLVVVDEIGDGGEVKFYIQGEEADQTSEFITFEVTNLDLTIKSAPDAFIGCGDNSCNNGETCSSCSVDCGSCSTNNNAGSSSGGGGSSSSSSSTSSSSNFAPSPNNQNNNEENEIPELSIATLNEKENQEQINPRITGAVIGFAKSFKGIATGVMIFIGLIGGLVFLNFRKKKSKKEKDEKDSEEENPRHQNS